INGALDGNTLSACFGEQVDQINWPRRVIKKPTRASNFYAATNGAFDGNTSSALFGEQVDHINWPKRVIKNPTWMIG
nr:hypothetical protein [Tanacetum cinerariifolium]